MKAVFYSSFKDRNDGTKVKVETIIERIDLTKDLGDEFIFIDINQTEPDRKVHESISFRAKDLKKVIKALKKLRSK